jgi:hypothetical protein
MVAISLCLQATHKNARPCKELAAAPTKQFKQPVVLPQDRQQANHTSFYHSPGQPDSKLSPARVCCCLPYRQHPFVFI